jgi:hypothetical protein
MTIRYYATFIKKHIICTSQKPGEFITARVQKDF